MFFIGVLLLQSTGIATFGIGNASAVIMLPAAIYAGYYFKEFAGVIFGFLSGVLLDTFSSTMLFNTITLSICAFFCGIIMSRLFNSNITAVCVLNIVASFVYFFAKWFIVYAFYDSEPLYILFNFTLPSAIYTAIIGIGIYFLLNPILSKLPVKRRH